MLRRSLIVLLAAVFTIAAPAAVLATTPPEPPTDTPAEPDPEPTSPATTVPAGDDEDSGNDLLPIVLIIGGIIALVAVLGLLFGRSKQPATRAATPPIPATPSPQSSLLDTAQWVHDQLSLELMAASPTAARQRWTTERTRLDNLAIGAQQQFTAGNDPNWQPFGQTVSSLAVSIDTNLELRAQDPPNAQLIQESTDVVNRNRATLQQFIYALRQTTTR